MVIYTVPPDVKTFNRTSVVARVFAKALIGQR